MQLDKIEYDGEKGLFIFQIEKKSYWISYDFYLTQSLHKDMELDEKLLQAIQTENAWNRAYASAFRYVSYRMRTRRELENRLYHNHIPADTIRGVADKLESLGFLDDARYAENYAEEKSGRSAWSRRKIQAKLMEKGISHDLADQAVRAISEEQETENIHKALDGQYGRLDLTEQKDFDKVYRGLMSKGFLSSMVLSIMKEKRERAQTEKETWDEN